MKEIGKWTRGLGPLVVFMAVVLAPRGAMAQAAAVQEPAQPAAQAPAEKTDPSSQINLNNAPIAGALNLFSRWYNRSIVIGPTVTNLVTLRLNLEGVRWDEALDTILRPYGYGYKTMGETIVVYTADDLKKMEVEQPMVTEVFNLKFLNAGDVVGVISNQLSVGRGASVNVLLSEEDKGWEFQSKDQRSQAAGAGIGEKRQRVTGADKAKKSKTLIVRDVPAVLEKIRAILASIDKIPTQILIEARFIEVKSSFLRDIGMEWGTGANGAETEGVQGQSFGTAGNVFSLGGQQSGGGVSPAAFTAASGSTMNDRSPFNTGLALKFQQLTGVQFEVLLHALQEDDSANILSSPRVLTLNNKEASINVGTKFPIIRSDVSGTSQATISTSLEYYENIGIQLNVVPQVCGDGYVNLIVHPAVTDQIGTEGGIVVTAGSIDVPLTKYPVLSVREAETQIYIKSGSTVVIAGLLKSRDAKTQLKVPFFGSIPFLGWLFRRDTGDVEKLDLLIFLTATVMPTGDQIASEIDQVAQAREETRRFMQKANTTLAEADKAVAAERAARLRAEERARAELEARESAERKIEDVRKENDQLQKTQREEATARDEAAARAEADRIAQARAEKEKLAAEKKAKAEAARLAKADLKAKEQADREEKERRLQEEKAKAAEKGAAPDAAGAADSEARSLIQTLAEAPAGTTNGPVGVN